MPGVLLESMEGRVFLAADTGLTFTPPKVKIDYTYDTTNFFNTPAKRDILQSAVDLAVSQFSDSLLSIDPGGGNDWKAVFNHPATGQQLRVSDLTVDDDTLLVFVGSRTLSDAIAIGGPGGYTATGSNAWLDRVGTRGQDGAGDGASADDFGPWGGSITFDPNPDGGWYFGSSLSGLASDANDFYSVAVHEMTHVLGFGTSDSFTRLVVNGRFTGDSVEATRTPAASVALSGDRSHWAEGTMSDGRETAMDPTISAGVRKLPTTLDLAAMDDIGWDLPITVAAQPISVAAGQTQGEVRLTLGHYRALTTTQVWGGELDIIGPGGFSAAATFDHLEAGATGDTQTAVYKFDAPGGTWDSVDNGTYALKLATAYQDGFGNASKTGDVGTFTAAVEGPPVATLAVADVTDFGGATHDLVVTYADNTAVDLATLDANDLTVTRADGLALTLIGPPTTDATASGTPIKATYTVAAPAGGWTPADNGVYTVTLNADQVADTNGNVAPGGVLGTFRVAVGAISFGGKTKASYVDADGETVVVSLKGPGEGTVMLRGNEPADAAAIELTGTTLASSLTISVRGGTTVGKIATDGSLRAISGKTVDLVGDLSIAGAAGTIQLRNLSGSHVTIGSGFSVSLSFAQATDVIVDSASPLRAIKGTAWLDTDATPDHITTPTVTSLKMRGDFGADITAASLGSASIGGVLSGADLRLSDSVRSLTVGAASGSRIFAGVRSDVATLPAASSDFQNAAAVIRSFSIKSPAAGGFASSLLAAPLITRAKLGGATGTVDQLFGASADAFGSITGFTAVGPFKFSRLAEAQEQSLSDGVVIRVV